MVTQAHVLDFRYVALFRNLNIKIRIFTPTWKLSDGWTKFPSQYIKANHLFAANAFFWFCSDSKDALQEIRVKNWGRICSVWPLVKTIVDVWVNFTISVQDQTYYILSTGCCSAVWEIKGRASKGLIAKLKAFRRKLGSLMIRSVVRFLSYDHWYFNNWNWN